MRGFTLIEILITGGLALLCITIMLAMFVPSVMLHRQQSGVAEAQQSANLALYRLRSGILSSLPETVSVANSGQAISWRRGDPDTPFNTQGGRNFVNSFDVYAWDSAQQELRFTPWSPAGFDFSLIGALPAAQFPAVMTQNTRVVARNVVQFQVTHPLTFPLQVQITISPPTHRGKRPSWTFKQSIMPTSGLLPE